jgi:hypothetical protein
MVLSVKQQLLREDCLKNAAAFKIRKRVVFPDKESYQVNGSPRVFATFVGTKV